MAAFHVPSVWLQDLVLKRRPAQELLVDPNRLIHKQQASALIHLYNIGAKVGAEHANEPPYNLNIIANENVPGSTKSDARTSCESERASCHMSSSSDKTHTTVISDTKYNKSLELIV